MCDFLDREGNTLFVNDEIEYWSSGAKDWLKALVREIHTITEEQPVPNDTGTYDLVPVTKTKIKVAKWDDNRYKSYDYMNLTKPENIRKV